MKEQNYDEFAEMVKEMHNDINEEEVILPNANIMHKKAFNSIESNIKKEIVDSIKTAASNAKMQTDIQLTKKIWNDYGKTMMKWLKEKNYLVTFFYHQTFFNDDNNNTKDITLTIKW